MKGVRNIFVVDDDNTQAMMLQDYLSKYSTITVHIYNSGEDCLAHMDLEPEIIFLDLNMPLMNGFEFLILLKTEVKLSGIPVIIFSTSDNPSDKKRARDLGALRFITKTADIQLLKRDLIQIFNSELLPT